MTRFSRGALVCAALVLLCVVAGCSRQKTTTNTSESRPAAETPARADTGQTGTAATAGAESLVTVRNGTNNLKAYIARPQGTGPFPGVVVVHEWWGLNQQIRGVADRLAAQGYVAIVPDLYHGRVTDDPEKAHEILRGLSDDAAVADLRAAVAELRSTPEVAQKPVGIVGFCMGGRLALLTALSGEPLNACAMFYGPPVTDKTQLQKLPCPVLGSYGAEDEGISAETVKTFEQNLKDAGKKADIKIYDKAGHAFMNETRPSYRPDAATDAWSRLQNFFSENLK